MGLFSKSKKSSTNTNETKLVDAETPPLDPTEVPVTTNDEDAFFQSLSPQEQRAYKTLKRISYVMDESIKLPCMSTPIGIDPLIGLVPVLGDFGSAAVSLAFVARAAPYLSRYTVLHMLWNVGVDSVVGAVPIAGDAFDFYFKANAKNLALFEDHMRVGRQVRSQQDKKWLVMVLVLVGFAIFIMTASFCAMVVILILFLTGAFESS